MGTCIILCMSLSLWLWSNVCHSEKNTIQAIFCCPCIYSIYVYFESIDGAIPVLQSWLWHTPCPSKNYIINLSQSLDCHQILLYVVQPEKKSKSYRRIIYIVCIQHGNTFESHSTEFIPWKWAHENVQKGWLVHESMSNTSIEGVTCCRQKGDSTLKKLWHASSSFQRRNAQRHSSPSFLY